ncbi:hypothetical protein EVAR_37105_1 [Eumeta japonica]|uniref:Uncharacterized protein n=1 Tax=Eumeta variegata TaxID=151549 RepID=A0A4C1XSV2_EUMVA|nr:hypothetical protein EVAR_37105_1 [Eumeta japonica]
MEGLRKTLEEKPKIYAAAAAKPKPSEAAKPQASGLMTTPTHTIIVSSRCANHTSDQVVKAIREVVDAREMGIGVDRVRKARNQKVVLSCASQEAIKRIEARIKIRSKDLQVTKPEPALPLVIIRDVLKINSDQDIVDSLKGQNSHITEGLEWEKIVARVRYRRRARNPLECQPVLEVSPVLYTRLIKAGHIYVGLQRRPVWDQSPLYSARAASDSATVKYCREEADKCAHSGGDHTGLLCQARKNS